MRGVALTLAAVAALCLSPWAPPPAGAQEPASLSAPPVTLRTVTIPQDVAVVRGPTSGADAPPAAGQRLQATGGTSAAVTLDAGATFTMLGVLCDAPPAPGDVVLSLRTSLDGRAWSAWYEAPLERAGEDGAAGGAQRTGALGAAPGAFTEAIWTDDGRYVQLAARSVAGNAPLALTGVRLVAIDTEGEQAAADRFTDGSAAAAPAAASGAGPRSRAAAAEPSLVTREQWGADESLRRDDPAYAPVKMAFVHHTAGGNTYSRADAPGIVRGIYAYHVKGVHFNDIGYNFLIDRFGTIYVGRYGGPRQGVVGAQVYGFNTGSTGVSVIGTYTDAAPPTTVLTALEELLAWKLELHGLNPLGTVKMTCGATEKHTQGETVTFPVIAGHRDANYTACPGDAFYGKLPTIRKATGRRFPPPEITQLTLSTPELSPNGDGRLDRLQVSYTISETARWTVQIVNAKGQIVRAFNGEGEKVGVIWDGKDAAGARAADGVYTVNVTATSKYGSVATRAETVTIDTAAPRVQTSTLLRTAFSPNGDGWKDTTRLTFTPVEACSVRVLVLDAGGATRRLLHDWTDATHAARTVSWGGKLERDGRLVDAADGAYTLRVELRDNAGNTRGVGFRAIVDRTVGPATVAPATISPNGDGVQDAAGLSFTLTRRASVVLTIAKDGVTVRTLRAGSLAPGAQTVTWDGRTASGARAANGGYRATISATSALGTTDVVAALAADRYKPRLAAPGTATLTLGQSAKVAVTVDDPHSPEVERWCTVTSGKGKQLGVIALGWVKTSEPATASWRPTGRGTLIFTFGARDRGGNREYAPVQTVVTVR